MADACRFRPKSDHPFQRKVISHCCCPRPLPEWTEVHRELRRRDVTLALLWEEYKAVHPQRLQYSRFCERYRAWASRLDAVMRQEHRAGEKLFVDYAERTVAVVERETGEIRQAQVFVAVPGASNRAPRSPRRAASPGAAWRAPGRSPRAAAAPGQARRVLVLLVARATFRTTKRSARRPGAATTATPECARSGSRPRSRTWKRASTSLPRPSGLPDSSPR